MHVAPAPGVRWLDTDGLVVVLEPRRRRFVELSESGSELWSAIVEHHFDLPATTRFLRTEFGLTRAEADTVIDGVVRELVDAGILTTDGVADEPRERAATPRDAMP